MVNQTTSALSGMAEIAGYVRRSHDTVLLWVRTMDFPAVKIGGIWESDRGLIDEWKRSVVRGENLSARPDVEVVSRPQKKLSSRNKGKR
jgi:hypothetical protein